MLLPTDDRNSDPEKSLQKLSPDLGGVTQGAKNTNTPTKGRMRALLGPDVSRRQFLTSVGLALAGGLAYEELSDPPTLFKIKDAIGLIDHTEGEYKIGDFPTQNGNATETYRVGDHALDLHVHRCLSSQPGEWTVAVRIVCRRADEMAFRTGAPATCSVGSGCSAVSSVITHNSVTHEDPAGRQSENVDVMFAPQAEIVQLGSKRPSINCIPTDPILLQAIADAIHQYSPPSLPEFAQQGENVPTLTSKAFLDRWTYEQKLVLDDKKKPILRQPPTINVDAKPPRAYFTALLHQCGVVFKAQGVQLPPPTRPAFGSHQFASRGRG